MNKIINNILIQSGWYPNRKVSKPYCIEVLKKYKTFEKLTSFITEYDELVITFDNPKNKSFKSNLIIKPIIADSEIDTTILKSYEIYTGLKLIPTAIIYEYSMIICISEIGSFFGGNDDWLIKLGDNFEEALSNLINGTMPKAELVDLLDEDE